MQFDDGFGQGEADTQSRRWTLERITGPREHAEYQGKRVWFHATAGVARE
jgi:hypothetical protein